METMPYSEVLKAAQRLPIDNQVELAEAILRNLRSALQAEAVESVAEGALTPLKGMSEEELRVLADAVLAPSHQQELQRLLDKNRTDALSVEEKEKLDSLLAEADCVALLKARALYTIAEVHGQTSETQR